MSAISGTPGATPRLGTPASILSRWPERETLAVCTDGPWTVIARPVSARDITDPSDLCQTRSAPTTVPHVSTHPRNGDEPPLRFRSGRVLALSYHLGAALEPAAGDRFRDQPLGIEFEIPGVLAWHRETGAWTTGGDADELLAIAESINPDDTRQRPAFRVGRLSSDLGRDGYTRIVRRGLDAIAAGDVYQVNLAHRLRAPFEGSTRAFFAALLDSAEPVHGAYVETTRPDGSACAICSASPELFLRFDAATRRVTTRPMKGTRPIDADPDELRRAAKDKAELDMITDLMRNDLGRVCAFGSVRVDAARTIEAHADSVWQATSTVSGTLRDGLTHADLLRATFPPGSVTGAPKIRAMQLIDELEHSPRGFYCGSVGWIDDSGDAELNVAIRTAPIEMGPEGRRELHYHAGAGIVADSEPGAEWAETLEKTTVLRRLFDSARHDSPSSASSCFPGD